MANVTFSSVALRAALQKATDGLKADVLTAQSKAATTLVSVLTAKYPIGRTGNLRKGVRKQQAVTSGWIVRSNAKHVHFLEAGTRDRFDNTRKNARRGRVKATPIFIPAAVRERASYVRDVQQLLGRQVEL